MKTTYTALKEGKAQFSISLEQTDLKDAFEHVIKDYQASLDIKGFRKGKIPRDVIVQRVGNAALLEDAVKHEIPEIIAKACEENNVDVYGDPDIKITKLSPDQPIEIMVDFLKLPNVTLTTISGLDLVEKNPEVKPEEIQKTLEQLQKMYSTEELVLRAAQKGDKVIIDFSATMDSIPLEGGSAKKQPIMIGDNLFIPGFEEQLIGLTAGAKKDFTLKFPANYSKKDLANKDAIFSVTVHEVYAIKQAPLDDAFAAKLGAFKTIDELKKQLEQNLKQEAIGKERDRFEQELLKTLIQKNSFEDIPEAMINDESERMIEELKRAVERDGAQFEDYLTSIKKSPDDLKKEFKPRATERIKSALMLRHIAHEHKLYAEDKHIDAAIDHEREHHATDPKTLELVNSDQYRRQVAHSITTRNVLHFLKEKNIRKK